MQPENPTNCAAGENEPPHAASIVQTLTAYLDGELSEPLHELIEARIAAQPGLRSMLAELEAGRALGLELFEALAREPVPPRLTRLARSA